MKHSLEKVFSTQDVEIVRLRDTHTTGNFEVMLMQTGKLIYSKKDKALGGGKCETEADRQRVVNAVREYLDSRQKQ